MSWNTRINARRARELAPAGIRSAAGTVTARTAGGHRIARPLDSRPYVLRSDASPREWDAWTLTRAAEYRRAGHKGAARRLLAYVGQTGPGPALP